MIRTGLDLTDAAKAELRSGKPAGEKEGEKADESDA